MTADAVTEQAQSSPVVLYFVIGGLVLGVIAGVLLPQLRKLLDGARRIAADRDDAVLEGLRTDVQSLSRDLAAMRARQEEHDRVLVTHRAWDQAVMNDPLVATRQSAPPLYPTLTPPAPPAL